MSICESNGPHTGRVYCCTQRTGCMTARMPLFAGGSVHSRLTEATCCLKIVLSYSRCVAHVMHASCRKLLASDEQQTATLGLGYSSWSVRGAIELYPGANHVPSISLLRRSLHMYGRSHDSPNFSFFMVVAFRPGRSWAARAQAMLFAIRPHRKNRSGAHTCPSANADHVNNSFSRPQGPTSPTCSQLALGRIRARNELCAHACSSRSRLPPRRQQRLMCTTTTTTTTNRISTPDAGRCLLGARCGCGRIHRFHDRG